MKGTAPASQNLRAADPSLRQTSSVQVDTPTLQGQYFPSAYAPLDFQYQTTWNDQVGGPDYLAQPLFVTALLEMQRGNKPTWISNAMGPVLNLSDMPGKMVRDHRTGLPFGATGNGFALEGFSNLLGGMNKESNWANIKGKAGEMDVRSGREFLDRFSALAVEGHGDHGVGILFSKTQFGRQYIIMGFGTPPYQALIALTRLGYTPRFVTEEELQAGHAGDVQALLIIGQTVPLPAPVTAGIAAFVQRGGRLLLDGSSTETFPGAVKLDYSFPYSQTGQAA